MGGGATDTALIFAAMQDNAEVIEVLLAHGADIEGVEDENFTALDKAIQKSKNNAVNKLLSHQANCSDMHDYPRQCEEYFNHLTLVPTPPALLPDGTPKWQMYPLPPGETATMSSNLASYTGTDIYGIWSDDLKAKGFIPTMGDPRTRGFVVPIRYAAREDLIAALVNTALEVKSTSIFENEVVRLIVDEAWQNYGRAYHIFTTVFYGLLLCSTSVANYRFETWLDESIIWKTFAWLAVAINIALAALFLCYEAMQLLENITDTMKSNARTEAILDTKRDKKTRCPKVFASFMLVRDVYFGTILYCSDVYNIMDVSAYVLVLISNFMRINQDLETVTCKVLLCLSALLLWFKCVYFLRPFEATGPLVRMLSHISVKIIPFLFLLILVLFGFSQTFYILSFREPTMLNFSAQSAFVNAFASMTGIMDFNVANDTIAPNLATFIFVLFVAVTSILLLNMLIALMNDAYAAIRQNSESEGKMQRCQIIQNQIRYWDVNPCEYLFVLKRNDDIENQKRKIDGEQRLSVVQSDVSVVKSDFALLRNDFIRLQSDMDEMRNDIRSNFAEILKCLNGPTKY